MCGRFTLKTPVIDWLYSLFPEDLALLEPLARAMQRANPLLAAARYNISPTQPVWGITQIRREHPVSFDELSVQGHPIRMLRWGLIPAWADSTKVAYSMINARAETIFEKPSFKNLIQFHRCVIVADGYYEWQRPSDELQSRGAKQPFWIHRPEEKPFAIAGLWTENRKVQPTQVLESTTIITTEANEDTSQVHDRMPVLLPDGEAIERWLSTDTDLEEITAMLVPAKKGFLQSRAVSPQVNSPRHDGPQLIYSLGKNTQQEQANGDGR